MQIGRLFESNIDSENRYLIHQGGTRCFHEDQRVITSKGLKRIKDISIGDYCLSSIHGSKSFKKVLNVFKLKNNKPTIRIRFKNKKEIIATDDHKFFYEGGWHSLKHLLLLINDKQRKQ